METGSAKGPVLIKENQMGWTKKTAKKQEVKDRKLQKLGQVGKRIPGTSGRCTLAVDRETFVHAVETNGGVQAGGKTCFDDPEWMNDQKRKHRHLIPEGEGVPGHNWGRPATRTRILPDGRCEETNMRTGEVRIYTPNLKRPIRT